MSNRRVSHQLSDETLRIVVSNRGSGRLADFLYYLYKILYSSLHLFSCCFDRLTTHQLLLFDCVA
jgi:hypothetical protein